MHAVPAHLARGPFARWQSLRSPWAALGALLAIDLVSRASYLAPRLGTPRGAANYFAASIALWIVLRLLCILPSRPRLAIYATVVALPMAIEWGMFRSFGQFVETTDFLTVWRSPKVALSAAGGGGDRTGTLVVFGLAMAAAWLLPPAARPLRSWRAGVASLVLAAIVAVGASYWRAAPSLEHSQPAFCCALAGLLRRVATPARRAQEVAIPPAPPAPGERLPNVVLVLGESLAASHLTLYGYDRPTTPQLQALADRGDLIALKDAVVMGPHTRTSVPYIMTGLAGPDPGGRVFGAPSMLEYARARGYHTAFVSAQEESWGELDAILRKGADSFRTGLQFAPEVDVLKGCDDMVVLEKGVVPAIRSLPEPFLLVVHMDGSHVPYGHHSPPAYKVFPEDEGVNSIAAYDNTIRVTDAYVTRVFEELRARDPRAWMFFTSDHGQALGEGGAFYHRGYQSNVVRDPLLVFPPDDDARADWRALEHAPVSACDLTPTILHLMKTAPASAAPMDCVDLLGGAVGPRSRVVSAYTPAFLAEPTMLVLLPDGRKALYDLWRGTVTLDDGAARPLSEVALPAEVRARLGPDDLR